MVYNFSGAFGMKTGYGAGSRRPRIHILMRYTLLLIRWHKALKRRSFRHENSMKR